MRQAIGSTWVLQLVIIFMLIFVAFLDFHYADVVLRRKRMICHVLYLY